MKKILALVLALVLSLGLASVAFAAQIDDPQLDGDIHYEIKDTEVKVADGDTLKFWACFDGGKQGATYTITPALTDKDGNVLYFPINAEYKCVVDSGAEYGKVDFKVVTYENADEKVEVITGLTVEVTPNNPYIAENKTIKGRIYAIVDDALNAASNWVCYFEIELRNHYVDVWVDANNDGVADVANGSTAGYTGGNDLKDVVAYKEALILNRHFSGTNDTKQPAYVITTAQFDTLPAFTPVTVAYEGVVSIAFADAAIQTGINFDYAVVVDDVTKAELYANPAALPTVTFKFLSAEAVASATTITFDKAFLANVQKEIGTKDVYFYAGDEAVAVDLSKDTISVVLEAGSTLGSYFFTAEAPVVEEEKENVGTGASDMTSVCVALAVVSLVAAGAVCVKKVSK